LLVDVDLVTEFSSTFTWTSHLGLVSLARHGGLLFSDNLLTDSVARFRWDEAFNLLSSSTASRERINSASGILSSTSLGVPVLSGTADFAFSPFSLLDDDSFCRQLKFEQQILFFLHPTNAVRFSSVLNVILQQLCDLVTLLSILQWAFSRAVKKPERDEATVA
jgi:hypothetical protein